jgi:hypothetical protein
MKPQTKKILASTALVFGSLFSGGAANAVCVTPASWGAIEFSTTVGAWTRFYITQIKAILPSTAIIYQAQAGTTFHETLSDAQAAGQIVTVTGNGPACPLPISTNVFGGVVTAVQRYDQ